MRLSVLIPVFNSVEFLQAALNSVSKQTFAEFEIIAIDDGSTDGSLPLLQAHSVHEPRMRLISRRNLGLIATRNELVERATGEWVAWMDSDDLSEPDRFEQQVRALSSDTSLVCVGTDAQCIDPSGAPLNLETYPATHAEIVSEQMVGGGLRFPTTMMRRDAVLGVGGFREPFRMGEDLDLLIRMGEWGRLANVRLALYRYRQHVNSVCAGLSSRWLVYRDHILELARQRRESGLDVLQRGGSIDIPDIDERQKRRTVAMTYAFWASCAMSHSDRARALRYAMRAVGTDPLAFHAWSSLFKTALAKAA